jgi:hypothetical protein
MATRRMYFKAGMAFRNSVYFDFIGGKTSQDILLSLRHNSFTSGDFQNAAAGTVPCFQFPTTATFGGAGRALELCFNATGVFDVAMRVLDNAANYSMFEMEWIVLP